MLTISCWNIWWALRTRSEATQTEVMSRTPALPSNWDDVRGSLALIFVLMYEESADLSTLISSILKLFIEEFEVTLISLQQSQESHLHIHQNENKRKRPTYIISIARKCRCPAHYFCYRYHRYTWHDDSDKNVLIFYSQWTRTCYYLNWMFFIKYE
jgi:hypothetical protein